MADRTAARACFFAASAQEALATGWAPSSGDNGVAKAGVSSGSDAAVVSRSGGRSGVPASPVTETPALAGQGRTGFGAPDRPLAERVSAPVAVPVRERPLESAEKEEKDEEDDDDDDDEEEDEWAWLAILKQPKKNKE